MKKLALVIAISSTFLAVGAQAETFTGEDGLSLDLGGEVKLNVIKDAVSDADTAITFDEVNLNFKSTYVLDSGLTAIGALELTMGDQPDSAVAAEDIVDKAYVGLGYMGAEFTLGQQTTAGDEFGIGEDKEFGVDGQLGATSGSDVLKAVYANDMAKVVISADLSESDDESSIDVYAEGYVGDFTVAATIQSSKTDADADSVMNYGVSGKYALDAYTIGAEFTVNADSEDMAYEIAGTYAVNEEITLGAGGGQWLPKDDNLDSVAGFYANATYALHSNVSAFVELAGSNADDAEVGYATGLSVSF